MGGGPPDVIQHWVCCVRAGCAVNCIRRVLQQFRTQTESSWSCQTLQRVSSSRADAKPVLLTFCLHPLTLLLSLGDETVGTRRLIARWSLRASAETYLENETDYIPGSAYSTSLWLYFYYCGISTTVIDWWCHMVLVNVLRLKKNVTTHSSSLCYCKRWLSCTLNFIVQAHIKWSNAEMKT